jgi:hypothetical protein
VGSDDLVSGKASLSKEGVSLEGAIGHRAPGVLAKLFPKHFARARVTTEITRRIVDKIATGGEFEHADVEFATAVLGEENAKWIRRQEIAARALRASEEAQRALPPAASQAECPKQAAVTAQDWISRFWENAGLVSDEVLQEIYGRLLAGEARTPGLCSMRTLRVLQYMDRRIADDFA